jgi:DNA-binding PadR family transcriptional regulator
MVKTDDPSQYLPLSETTYYTMLSLAEEAMHGYALMQKVKETSHGSMQIGAGTLYTIFSTLEKEALIEMVSEEDRRKTYTLTPKGVQVLQMQIRRLEIMADNGRRITKLLSEKFPTGG